MKVSPGRFTAEVDKDFVVFLIGMRVNQWWRFDQWVPVAMAMPFMLRRLMSEPSLGMLAHENFFRLFPITTCLVTYWKDFESLERFSKDPSETHLGAWSRYNQRVGKSGVVGVWHETYKVTKGDSECVYANMPVFGLAKATRHVPISPPTDSARQRIS